MQNKKMIVVNMLDDITQRQVKLEL